ncbi:organic hydroperoxide resistance protein [Coprinopsis cinerea AmutBmut pab1-1]|nr:organic hydroperoxide resistance protein [Coprinopsis cinerea AmutBmut pab1-1]
MNVLTTASRRLASGSSRAYLTRPVASYGYRSARTVTTLSETKYTAKATATGAGRNGTVESNGLSLNLATPKELGGTGNGQNPEQLFAMGYAGCFLGAVQFQAKQHGRPEVGEKAKVHTEVHIGTPTGGSGFGLAVDITVEGVDQEILQAAHAVSRPVYLLPRL